MRAPASRASSSPASASSAACASRERRRNSCWRARAAPCGWRRCAKWIGLERNLAMLATVGSTSPYVGLFGTVWGIMSAFHNLGNVQQATLAAVAPGIAEALIATADRLVRRHPRRDGLQPLRRSGQPSGTAVRYLRRRVLHHTAAPWSRPVRRRRNGHAATLRRRKLMGEINVVPYIDVMLVLLVIFMITAPLLKEGVKVDLPDAGAKPIDAEFLAKHEPLILTIDSRGRLYINFGQNQDQARLRSHRERAHLRATAPRPANSGAGEGRYHGALWHGGAGHGAAAACRRLEGGFSDRSGAATRPRRKPAGPAAARVECRNSCVNIHGRSSCPCCCTDYWRPRCWSRR